MKAKITLLAFIIMTIILLSSCVDKPTPVPTPTPTPIPEKILYLIVKDDQQGPVYTDYKNYIELGPTVHAGDTIPVRQYVNWEGFYWYECLVGHLQQFETGAVGWIKFKSDKYYLEWRQP